MPSLCLQVIRVESGRKKLITRPCVFAQRDIQLSRQVHIDKHTDTQRTHPRTLYKHKHMRVRTHTHTHLAQLCTDLGNLWCIKVKDMKHLYESRAGHLRFAVLGCSYKSCAVGNFWAIKFGDSACNRERAWIIHEPPESCTTAGQEVKGGGGGEGSYKKPTEAEQLGRNEWNGFFFSRVQNTKSDKK